MVCVRPFLGFALFIFADFNRSPSYPRESTGSLLKGFRIHAKWPVKASWPQQKRHFDAFRCISQRISTYNTPLIGTSLYIYIYMSKSIVNS